MAADWSSGKITAVGTAGNMHGLWGNNVRWVGKMLCLPSGTTWCAISWRSRALGSHDHKSDMAHVNGTTVWAHTQSCGHGLMANGAELQTYFWAHCLGPCQFYLAKHIGSWSGWCSGSLSVMFTSNIDQAGSDQGWGFNNFVLTAMAADSSRT